MNKLILYLCCLGVFTCSINSNIVSSDNVKVINIDKKKLNDYHFIECIYVSNGSPLIVLSEKSKDVYEKKKMIKEKHSYFFDLKKLSYFKEKNDIANLPLIGRDLYIEGELFFPKNIEVFKAENLMGIYLNP